MKTRLTLATIALSAAAFGATPYDTMNLKGRTDKENPVAYKVGEPIVFTLFSDLKTIPTNGLKVVWTCSGDDGQKTEGEAPFALGEITKVTTSLTKPGFVKLEAHLVDAAGNKIMRDIVAPGEENWTNNKGVNFYGGAGANVSELRQAVPEPRDFDEFWAKQRKLLASVPMRTQRYAAKGFADDPDQRIECVYIACPGYRPATGFLVMPKGAAPKSCSIKLGVQGYGCYRPSVGKQKDLGNEIRFFMNAHGLELEAGQEYYDDYFAAIDHSDAPWTSYAWNVIENQKPETCYFRDMALRVMRALEFLKTLPEWNGKDLVVEGGSQGGLQTCWAAGLDPDVSLARPGVPWCCDMGIAITPRLKGHWYIPYAPGLDYFDPINHIRRAKCPVEITRAGLCDYTSPPSAVAALYNAIPGKGSIYWVQGAQHGNTPPAPNQTITLRK